jgi:predicted O-linked N-acetylglucosamine transferase (SPINDLY family)
MAVKAYHQALQLDPDDLKSAFNLSLLYRKMGNDRAAISACQLSIKAKPDFAEAFSTLGLIFCDHGQFDMALVCLEQALAIKPDLPQAHLNMGVVYQKCGQYERGLASYGNAQACDPTYAPAHWLSLLSLPMLYDSPSQIDQYRGQFTRNMDRLLNNIRLATDAQKQFALKGVQTTTNFYLQYQGGNDRDLQTKYGRFVHRVMAANYPQWAEKRVMPPHNVPNKIRIGYVSSFMCHHTVGTFLSGWVENHDTSAFEIHCYHVGRKVDSLTEHFKNISHRFHFFCGDVETAARQINEDHLHILVYSDIGMDSITLQLAALRLAPVQCKGWGHPVTTGLPTVDYYLSSDLMEPPQADQHYSERLVRLPNLALCYRKPQLPEHPKTRRELAIPSNRFVYLSTQSIFKYLPQHDDLFVHIARQIPNALFVFISNQSAFATERFRHRLRAAFSAYDLEADHFCHFVPQLNFSDFLSLNMAADVLLDTLEWSGGKTTLEALSCGVPVVTCPGRFMRGRHAYAMLKTVGVPETIGSDKAGYIRIAVRLARDPSFYADVKSKLKRGCHKLYDDQEFMSRLEIFYKSVVQKQQHLAVNLQNDIL